MITRGSVMLPNVGGVVWIRNPLCFAAIVNPRRHRVTAVTNGYFGIGYPFIWLPGQPMPAVTGWVRYVQQVALAVTNQVNCERIVIRPPSGLADIRTTILLDLATAHDARMAGTVLADAVNTVVGQSPLHVHEVVRRRRLRPAPVLVDSGSRELLQPWASMRWGYPPKVWRDVTGLVRIPLPA